MRNTNQDGFTLVELMVTISILAIIATMAVPSFQSQLYNYQLKKEFNALVATIVEAKSNAKALNKSIHIYFREKEPSDPENSLYVHLDSSQYISNKTPTDEIIFRNNGLVDTKCIDIQQTKTGNTKKIELNPLGIYSVADGKCLTEPLQPEEAEG